MGGEASWRKRAQAKGEAAALAGPASLGALSVITKTLSPEPDSVTQHGARCRVGDGEPFVELNQSRRREGKPSSLLVRRGLPSALWKSSGSVPACLGAGEGASELPMGVQQDSQSQPDSRAASTGRPAGRTSPAAWSGRPGLRMCPEPQPPQQPRLPRNVRHLGEGRAAASPTQALPAQRPAQPSPPSTARGAPVPGLGASRCPPFCPAPSLPPQKEEEGSTVLSFPESSGSNPRSPFLFPGSWLGPTLSSSQSSPRPACGHCSHSSVFCGFLPGMEQTPHCSDWMRAELWSLGWHLNTQALPRETRGVPPTNSLFTDHPLEDLRATFSSILCWSHSSHVRSHLGPLCPPEQSTQRYMRRS